MGEEDGQADAYHQNVADHIQQRILGDGLEIGEDQLVQAHDQGHQNGAIDGFNTEFRAYQQKADDQKKNVHDQGDGGHAQRNEVTEHHGKSRAAAYADMAGQHEEKYGGGNNDGTEGYDGKFFEGIAQLHRSHLVGKSEFIIRIYGEKSRSFFFLTESGGGAGIWLTQGGFWNKIKERNPKTGQRSVASYVLHRH